MDDNQIDQIDKIWDMMDNIFVCMLATRDGEQIRSRPMAALTRRDENAVYFFTDAEAHTDDEVSLSPHVCLAFASDSQSYVSVTGRAELTNDRQAIRDLWCMPAKAWWDSPEDPRIRLLKVTPEDAEYWDSPGKVVSYVKMAAAAITGKRPAMGEHRKITIR